MKNTIRFRECPLDLILEKLLVDKTTGKKLSGQLTVTVNKEIDFQIDMKEPVKH